MSEITPITIEWIRHALILSVLALAVATDLRSRRIPDALTFPAMALGLIINGIGQGVDGLLWSAAGLLLGGALFALPFAFLCRGAGDVKLLAAVGALGGPEFVLWGALYAGVAGGIFAAAVLLARRRFAPVVAGMAADLSAGLFPRASGTIRLPYALPIAVGAVVALMVG